MPNSEEAHFVVAIGASAGGLSAISELIGELPNDLNAPIIVAVHSDAASRLTEVLRKKIAPGMRIKKAEDGDRLEAGWIYIVPGAQHALLRNGKIELSAVVKDSGFRPSIDALFMTMAAEYGPRAIAVVLSGTLKDGMRGAQIVHDMGGKTIVQDPDDAQHSEMPVSVIYNDHPETVRTAPQLGVWLKDLIGKI